MSIVRIENVTKKYGNIVAVNDLSLSIEEGEIFGLLGPNGAGKSTLINMITSLITIDEGNIYIKDANTKSNANLTKSFTGIVPQDIAIYEDLTCLENVKFFAGLYGLRGKELKSKAMEALEFTGLADKAKDFPKGFSGGMKRRLNIACAIAHNPEIIIMDEPTVGIDPQSRNHILQSVKELNRRGCTVIYTSHYMEEVEELCSRIAIIDYGKVIALGTKQELKSIVKHKNEVWVTVKNNIDKIVQEELKEIPGVTDVEIYENTVMVYSMHESENLESIIAYFTSKGLGILQIESKVPDLETVFLTLTGRKLRD
ncbi:MAG: ABC transporter ATP-binding protein [Clostridiaceae bacterium]|nr:ABC transporter ATP-binding protein [Clostridiaceae bacterium]